MTNKLLPCPFCGRQASLSTVGRSWYRITADHAESCLLEDQQFDCPQTDEQLPLLLRDWNLRAAPIACVIAFREGTKEPEILSWNQLPVGEHRLYASPPAPVSVVIDERAMVKPKGSPFT